MADNTYVWSSDANAPITSTLSGSVDISFYLPGNGTVVNLNALSNGAAADYGLIGFTLTTPDGSLVQSNQAVSTAGSPVDGKSLVYQSFTPGIATVHLNTSVPVTVAALLSGIYSSAYSPYDRSPTSRDLLLYLHPATAALSSTTLITPSTGAQSLVGGTGVNTLVVDTALNAATLSTLMADYAYGNGRSDYDGTVTTSDQSIKYAGFNDFQFVDGTLVTDPDDMVAQVYRIYAAALGRTPDAGGLVFWDDTAKQMGIDAVAQGFMSSPEFQQRFGSVADPTNFVNQIYQNVLGRPGDAGGVAYWVNLINTGAATRSQVLTGISNSNENKTNTSAAISAGLWVPNENAVEVARLYYSALDRAPDAGGLKYWTDIISSGQANLSTLANSFVNSSEFQTHYGALSNTGFVDQLYLNVLHRSASVGEEDYWSGTLNNGAARADVLIGFSESAEHKAALASVTEARGITLA